jgi:hypothetical protein
VTAAPLVFLARREYANAVRRRLHRLRSPRYLLALAAALVYLAVLLPGSDGGDPGALLGQAAPYEPLLVLGAALLAVWGWLFADRRTPLAFSDAELVWLFPAPLARRSLILYKLARWQLPLLFNAVLMTLLFSSDRSPAFALRRVIAVWILLATLRLHRLAASLLRSRWSDPLGETIGRNPAVVPVGLWAAVLLWHARGVLGEPDLFLAVRRFTEEPWVVAALSPASALVRPIFAAASLEAWVMAAAPALALLALHVAWVVAADAAFYRTALNPTSAQPTAARTTGTTVVRAPRSALRPLPPLGSAAHALTWKQLAPRLRPPRVLQMTGIFAGTLLLAASVRLRPETEYASLLVALLLFVLGALTAAGPHLVRLDLRRELPRWDLLRTLPMPGAVVLRGLGLATFVAVTVLQAAGLVLLLASDAGAVSGWGVPTWVRVLQAAVLLPPITALGSVVALAGAVYFPAWSAPMLRRAGGLDALGTNLLSLVAYLVVTALLALPAYAPTVLLARTTSLTEDALLPMLGTALGAWIVTAFEIRWLLPHLGRVFERTDRSAAGLS